MDDTAREHGLTHTHDDLAAFLREMGADEAERRRNYFRWLEYPLALSWAAPRRGERVLEIGSGFLNVMPVWMAAKFGASVTAVDRKPLTDDLRAYVATLRARFGLPDERLRVLEADARALPFEDGAFDLVMCVSTLEHVPLPGDSEIAVEIGRVLAVGGRAIVTFPYNHSGRHIESEEWGGEEYQQRHYNEFTARSRVIHPSGLWFMRAAYLGETDPAVGRRYLAWDEERRRAFCREREAAWRDYWKVYHSFERDEFYINDDEVPDETAQNAGILCLQLEKRELAPKTRYFAFEPFGAYLAGDRQLLHPEPGKGCVRIAQVRITNYFGHAVDAFESGQNIWFHIRLSCEGEVVEPVLRMVFHDEDGRIVAGLNTHEAGHRFGAIAGETALDIRFGMLNLVGGRYEVSVGVWDKNEPDPIPPYPFDVHYRQYPLIVRDRKPGLSGVAYIPYEITVGKTD